MPYLEINSSHFFHNYHTILETISPNKPQKIAIVLKDNAYGHGILEIANLAKRANIQTAFVKNTQEALSIAPLFNTITILYPSQNAPDFKTALKTPNLYFCAPSLESLQNYPQHTSIELKIDSGMHRNGISKTDLNTAFDLIKKRNLHLKGIFTHNGFGDDVNSAFYTQNMEFLAIKQEALKLCQHYGILRPRFHSLSSSGAMRASQFDANLPQELQDDLYRVGIAFYGYLCSDFQNPPLKPIAALFANKISTLKLKKGSNIGYSGMGILEQDSIVSTYDIGYGDGFFRLRENMQLHSAEGFRILPRASMDCISILTDAPKVCIFNDVRSLAKAFDTIPYEILAHLHAYIPRIVV